MTSPRDLHTATVLTDGTVLIAGGEDAMHVFGALSTAEIYDPTLRMFTSTTNTMSAARAQHTATRLTDGRVLLAGGEATDCCTFLGNYGSRPTAASDVYDPATHTFTATGSLAQARYNHAATRLADGRVLITGGITNIETIGFTVTSSAEIFDPSTNSYSPAGTMTTARYDHSSVLLPNGNVLIVGGPQSDTSAEIYDPSTQTFTAVAQPTLHSERGAAAFLLENGTVLLIGSQQAVEIYDPATQTFSDGGHTLFSYPYWSAIVRLTNGQIFLASNNESEIFDPATGSSVSVGDPGVGSLFPAGAALASNKALLTGGQTFVPFAFVASAAGSVLTPDRLPAANPGADRTISPGANCTAVVSLDGSASTDPDNDSLTYSWTEGQAVLGTSVAVSAPLGLGVHTITLTVDDGHGGTDSRTVTITVADTTGPTFTPPANVTLEQSGAGGTVYTPSIPIVTDNCDPNPTIAVSGVPAGSLFPAGTTSLTYTATDASHNTTVVVTTINVQDTIAPSIVISSPSSASYGLMQDVIASYACFDIGSGVASCSGPVPSGSALDTTTVGPHVFTVTAVDNAGHPSSASVTYTVTALPGRMAGSGAVVQGGLRGQFTFTAENDGGGQSASLSASISQTVEDASNPIVFRANSISSAAFWNDPAIDPGRAPKTLVDSVVLTGVGTLSGVSGYRFEMRAGDHGEPGVGHDTFTLTVDGPDGRVAAAISGTLVQGNIQSLPVTKQ